MPLGLLAHILRVDENDLLELLPPGTYIENPKAVSSFRQCVPEASQYLKNPIIVFDSGLRYLLFRNLSAQHNPDHITSILEKLLVLEENDIPLKVALKVLQCIRAGLKPEEIAVLVRKPSREVREIVRKLNEISITSTIPEAIPELPAFPA